MKLKQQVVSGFLWSAIEKVGSLVILFFVQVILMRLLSPVEYGLLAIISAFSAIASSVVDSGFSQALIQKQGATEKDYNSVFYLNIAISIVLYLILCLASVPVAKFYNAPAISEVMPVLALILPINALTLIHNTIKIKRMEFKVLSKTNLTASLVSGIIAISLALAGYGKWALVANILTLYVMRAILLWIQSDWRPKAEFSINSVKGLFRLGSRLFATGLITQTFNNIPQLIIGKAYGTAHAGLYSQSIKFKDILSQAVALPVQNVTFPAFATIQDEDEKLKLSCRKVVNILSFALFPVMIGLVAVAEEAIYVAFKEQWLPAVPYFKILTLSAIFMPLTNICQNIMKAKAAGNLILTLELVKKTFALIIIIYAASISVMAMAWAYLIWMGFEMLVNIVFVRRVLDYRTSEQIRDTLPYLIMAGVMYCAVVLCGHLIGDVKPIILLTTKMAIGVVVYLILAWIFKPDAWEEVAQIVKNALKKRA